MSDVDDYDDVDDDVEAEQDQKPKGNAARVLREQNSKLAEKLESLQKELDEYRAEKRKNTIADVLREKGANPKLAKYVSRDLEGDVTAEAVEKWLSEEGELFGYEPASEEDNEVAAEQQRISEAVSSAPSPRSGLTPEQVAKMPIDQLIEMGVIPKKQ